MGKNMFGLSQAWGRKHLFFLMPKSLTSNLCYLTIN